MLTLQNWYLSSLPTAAGFLDIINNAAHNIRNNWWGAAAILIGAILVLAALVFACMAIFSDRPKKHWIKAIIALIFGAFFLIGGGAVEWLSSESTDTVKQIANTVIMYWPMASAFLPF